MLTAQIQKEFPFLTLHDVAHLDALWTLADLIAGTDYPMTPTEAFVFGGAVLLHDAGLSIAAFKGGLPELNKTPEWRDSSAIATEKMGAYSDGDVEIIEVPDALL